MSGLAPLVQVITAGRPRLDWLGHHARPAPPRPRPVSADWLCCAALLLLSLL